MLNRWGSLIPYFRGLNRQQLKQIEDISKVYNCKNGDLIYLQGEFCQNWVIVNSGSFLTRVKSRDEVTSESIIMEGESYDFISTLDSSVTTSSLEAVGDGSLLIVDILGLKKLSKKNPITTSLIKEQLSDEEGKIWDKRVLQREKRSKSISIKIRESFISILIKAGPVFLLFNLLFTLIGAVTKFRYRREVSFIMLSLTFIFVFFYFLFSRLTQIEVSREFVVKRVFDIKLFESVNTSVPIEKVTGTCVNYKNRILRILKIGSVKFESANCELIIKGIFKPESTLKDIDSFKNKTLKINRAIEVSSFKSLYCKEKGLFYIESQLESMGNNSFLFRKSILYLLIRILPPLIIFLIISLGLYFIFENNLLFFINVISLFYSLWHYRDWNNDKYAFEEDKVVDIEKKPLWGKEKRIEADIASVQSIKKEQKNFFEILFNYGSIEVETLGDKIVYPFIHNPDKVIENLYLIKQYYYSRKESMEKMNRQEEFLNYTKFYQELSGR